MDTIFINKLKVDTIIGIYDFEKDNRQPIILDIELQYDTSQACASDNIRYAVDYHKLSQDIYEFVRQSSFQLIETLAEAIAKKILDFPMVNTVKLSLEKPNALDLAETVGIQITRCN